mgnify:FL=1
MSGIKNIIFDLGGVILNLNYKATKNAFEELGIKNFHQLYNQKEQIELFNNFEKGIISTEKFISIFQEITKLNKKQIIKAWNAMLLDLPRERLDFILSLKKNYNTYLLSNTNEIHIECFEAYLKNKGYLNLFKSCFNNIYYSCRIGDRKPNASCFNKVMNENKLSKEETLFIDDSTQHINKAKNMKINTYLMDQNKSIIKLFPDIIQQVHH